MSSNHSCPCPLHQLDPDARRQMIERVVDEFNAEILANGGRLPGEFPAAWEAAPKSLTRVTELEAAEYFFLKGRQAGLEEAAMLHNGDLREISRMGRERGEE